MATAGAKSASTPVVSVEVETPTYLEVPDFQRVAIIGDYASGVLSDVHSCTWILLQYCVTPEAACHWNSLITELCSRSFH